MRDKQHQQAGLMSLEASIVLTIFIFMMLYMYSLFVFFEARNEVGHVLLSTANSMAMDTYGNESLGESENIGRLFYSLYGNVVDNSNFNDHSSWHTSDRAKDNSGVATPLDTAIRSRFTAYVAGGDINEANRILEKMNIIGGMEGLDFSDSYIEEGNLIISVKYKMEFEFKVFNAKELTMQQSVCSKLW